MSMMLRRMDTVKATVNKSKAGPCPSSVRRVASVMAGVGAPVGNTLSVGAEDVNAGLGSGVKDGAAVGEGVTALGQTKRTYGIE